MSDFGLARTNQFLLSTAELMLGPSNMVFELTPSVHSVGLVKNVSCSVQLQHTELTQGVANNLVYSVNTSIDPMIEAEVFEYTARNLAYGAGLEGHNAAFNPITDSFAISTALTDASTTVVLAGTGNLTGWNVGDWLVLQDGRGPVIHIADVTVVNTTTRTLTINPNKKLPTGITWPVATTRVFRVQSLPLGTQPTMMFGAKLVGKLPENDEPVVLIFPKVRVVQGFNINFQTDNFASMQFQLKPFALTAADPFYSDFSGNRIGRVFRR